jgi:hypothetical protein
MTVLADRPTRQVKTHAPQRGFHLVCELRLAALPTAIVCAGIFTKYILRQWRLDELAGTAELLATELVAHAVQTTGIADPHPPWTALSHLRPILVRIHVFEQALLVEVADCEPTLVMADEDGFFLIQALSRRWSYYLPGSGGKVVWCELPLVAPSNVERTQELPRMLPQRVPKQRSQPVAEPIEFVDDPAVLQRVRDGLRLL